MSGQLEPGRIPGTEQDRDERRMRVMRMVNSGMTRSDIAKRIGVSIPTVNDDVRAAINNKLRIDTEEYVGRQLTQIEDLRRAVYARALKGDMAALDRALKLMDREARLLGLDAPARSVVHVSSEDFAATAANLMRDMGLAPHENDLELEPSTMNASADDEGVDSVIVDADCEVEDDWVW